MLNAMSLPVADTVYIHHCHLYYSACQKLILILLSHGWCSSTQRYYVRVQGRGGCWNTGSLWSASDRNQVSGINQQLPADKIKRYQHLLQAFMSLLLRCVWISEQFDAASRSATRLELNARPTCSTSCTIILTLTFYIACH